VGPDYIDPSYHQALAGRPSRNLDVALTGREHIISFFRYAKDLDIAVIKGVMGLYDSVNGVTELSSTADAESAGDTCAQRRKDKQDFKSHNQGAKTSRLTGHKRCRSLKCSA